MSLTHALTKNYLSTYLWHALIICQYFYLGIITVLKQQIKMETLKVSSQFAFPIEFTLGMIYTKSRMS